MNAKRLVIGTLAGALTLSATGYAMFGLAFPQFYSHFMNAGAATGVERQPLLAWAVVLGMLSYGALIALTLWITPGSLTVGRGITIGAAVSFLLWFTADFMLYGISNVGNLRGVVTDPLLKSVPGAIAGAVIAIVFGKLREAVGDVSSATRVG